MFRTYHAGRWPNNFIGNQHPKQGLGPFSGVARFSERELGRRRELVRARLRELRLDLLIVQGWFPPSTMGSHVGIYWLSGTNALRNAPTLILPADGELMVFEGLKPSSNLGDVDPYLAGEDMSGALRGARRIAYYQTGYMSWQFRDFLLKLCPGAQIADFSNELQHMMAVKSAEEIELIKDTCELQDRVWAAAPTFIWPGRTLNEIRADVWRMLLNMGADPTLMFKILVSAEPNDAMRGGNLGEGDLPPDYRIRETDYVRLCLETPGSGGYYTERARLFFFDEPHEELRRYHEEALALHRYQMGLYRPGASMPELREAINDYKRKIGAETESSASDWTPELRGVGMLTVDRPQIQYSWEDISLEPGHVFCTMARVRRGFREASIYDNAIVTEEAAVSGGRFPLDLAVL